MHTFSVNCVYCTQEAESNRLCRRLQLKDIIPVEMQRLTKYPLLLDNIAKYTGVVAFASPTTLVIEHWSTSACFIVQIENSGKTVKLSVDVSLTELVEIEASV